MPHRLERNCAANIGNICQTDWMDVTQNKIKQRDDDVRKGGFLGLKEANLRVLV